MYIKKVKIYINVDRNSDRHLMIASYVSILSINKKVKKKQLNKTVIR